AAPIRPAVDGTGIANGEGDADEAGPSVATRRRLHADRAHDQCGAAGDGPGERLRLPERRIRVAANAGSAPRSHPERPGRTWDDDRGPALRLRAHAQRRVHRDETNSR